MPTENEPTLAWGELRLGLKSSGEYLEALYLATVDRRRYRYMRNRDVVVGRSEADELLGLFADASLIKRRGSSIEALVEGPRGLALARVNGRVAMLSAAAEDVSAAEAMLEQLIERLPDEEESPDFTSIGFWSENRGNGEFTSRRLESRVWADVADGYATGPREELQELMSLTSPPAEGRLILWHGEPGTGKTNALRALAHAWRDWCSVHFITDPDRFVGMGMRYMLDVLRADLGELVKHRLVVLEDAGELLSVEARQQSGQGLSRLLNLSDGLLGIGMKTIILISTNEPLGRIHPAVHRPGRCLAEIEFTALDVDEATQWLERRGSDQIPDEPKTIAQLYALAQDRDQGAERQRVGFG